MLKTQLLSDPNNGQDHCIDQGVDINLAGQQAIIYPIEPWEI